MWRKLIFTVLGLTTVAGCGMPPKGTEILVDTAPPGASCVLSRGGQPLAPAEPTPAIAIVPIDTAALLAQCRRAGLADAGAVVAPAGRPSYPSVGYPRTEHSGSVSLV